MIDERYINGCCNYAKWQRVSIIFFGETVTIRFESRSGEPSRSFLFGSGPTNRELDRIECNTAQSRKCMLDNASIMETSKLIAEELLRKDRTPEEDLRLIAAMQSERSMLRMAGNSD